MRPPRVSAWAHRRTASAEEASAAARRDGPGAVRQTKARRRSVEAGVVWQAREARTTNSGAAVVYRYALQTASQSDFEWGHGMFPLSSPSERLSGAKFRAISHLTPCASFALVLSCVGRLKQGGEQGRRNGRGIIPRSASGPMRQHSRVGSPRGFLMRCVIGCAHTARIHARRRPIA